MVLQSVGTNGIAEIVRRFQQGTAIALTAVGVSLPDGTTRFFEGTVQGRIVAPRGSGGFGWDPIFQPEGEGRTYGEMTAEEKNQTSHRAVAWKQVAEWWKSGRVTLDT